MGKKSLRSKANITNLWRAVYKSDQYRAFKAAVRKKHGYICQVCKQKGTRKNRLHVHHIRPKACHLDSIFDIDNGMLLCQVHHIEEHRRMKEVGEFKDVPHVEYQVLTEFINTLSFDFYSKRRKYNRPRCRRRRTTTNRRR